jgi:hypothetical protein
LLRSDASASAIASAIVSAPSTEETQHMAKYSSVETLAHMSQSQGATVRITFHEFWSIFIEYPKNTQWDVLNMKEPPKKTLAVFGGRGEPLSKVANRANGILGSRKEMNDATT